MQPQTLLHENYWIELFNMTCGNFIVVTKQEILVMFLTDFFDAALRRHNDVILLPAICRVSGNDFVPAGQCTDTPCMCNSWTAASRNAKLSCIQPVASKQLRSQSCGLRDLGCNAASCLPQTNPQSGWTETAPHQCLVRFWTVDFWRDYWPVARKTSNVCPC